VLQHATNLPLSQGPHVVRMTGATARPRDVDADASWTRRADGRWIPKGLVVLVLLSVAATWTPRASADPNVTDEGAAIRRATWDFANVTDYAATNVSLAPGRAALAAGTRTLQYASDADFSGAQAQSREEEEHCMITAPNRCSPVTSLQNLLHLFWKKESVDAGLPPLPRRSDAGAQPPGADL